MPERIDARPVLTVLGAALLLISLFLTWYTIPPTPPAVTGVDVGNAWQVFESLDLILAGIAIVSIFAAWEQVTGRDRLGSFWMLPLGLTALIVVGSQILDAPPSILQADPATGAWLGLGGAVAMVVGGLLSTAHVSLALELDSQGGGSSTGSSRRRAAQDA
jgi:hypothetical protein